MISKKYFALAAMALCAAAALAQDETDVKGSADHPLFTRMPGFYIAEYDVKDYYRYEPSLLSGADAVWEGKMTFLAFSLKTGAKQPSMLQIAQNYENAIRKIGGKILTGATKDGRTVQGKLEKNGTVTYVETVSFNDGTRYWLTVIEKQAMKQDVVADADALKSSIASTGKAVAEGIFFEADKAVVKPESGPAIEEIVKLLKQNPALKLYVVGHTADSGSLESGLKLSGERADAIVKALVSKGVAASRLKAAGLGPYCPAASNRTEEGKAKNRRVELVEQM
jgi:outer membrane protein OmpA-like peptidoglycan-associated protein